MGDKHESARTLGVRAVGADVAGGERGGGGGGVEEHVDACGVKQGLQLSVSSHKLMRLIS